MRCVGVIGMAVAACSAPKGPSPATDSAIADSRSSDARAGDARLADAAADAMSGPITVTVFGNGVDSPAGKVASGVDVDFVAPDGTDALVVTGSDGVATALGVAGTTAFVVHREGDLERFIDAYVGLAPGDSIVDGDPTPPGPDTCIASPNATFPAFDDATLYKVALSCSTGTQGSATTLPIFCVLDCPQFGAASAVVSATDSLGNLGYSSLAGVDMSTHTDAAHPLVFPAFQPASTITAGFTNLDLPPNTSQAELVASYVNGSDPTRYGFADLMIPPTGPSISATAPIVPFGDTTQLAAHLTVHLFDPVDYAQQLAGLMSTVEIDASTMIHPATGGQIDPTSDQVDWTEAPVGVDAPSALTVQVRWTTSSGIEIRLDFTAPRGTAPAVAIPHLPASFAQLDFSHDQLLYVVGHARTFVGKTYHDVLVGQTGDAAMWQTSF